MTSDPKVFVGFGGTALAIHAPADFAQTIAGAFQLTARPPDSGATDVWIDEIRPGRFRIRSGTQTKDGLARREVLDSLIELLSDPAEALPTGVPLRAAAVGWGERAILLAGPEGVGKSALAAWFVDKGFSYIADDLTVVLHDPPRLCGFAAPLGLRVDALRSVTGLTGMANAPALRWADRMLISPAADRRAYEAEPRCGLILFPRFRADVDLDVAVSAPDQSVARLVDCRRRPEQPDDDTILTVLAESTPALTLDYGGYPAIDGVLDQLARFVVESESDGDSLGRFIGGLGGRAAAPPRPALQIPKADRPALDRPLTVGMATYDDYDGVYFTIQALRLYHQDVLDQIELLVVDNHPDGPAAPALKALEDHIPNYRYVPENGPSGTATSRNRVFEAAGGAFVLCLDCHVLVVPGALRRLLAHCAADPTSNDLLQGPMLYDDMRKLGTHFAPVWRGGMYGIWDQDPAGIDPDAPPFDIPMQGLGLFACRRAAWPGFNPALTGFGGEEGYIHEKIRRRGGRTLCLPFLRWMHRFNRPLGVPYRNTWDDRFRNYWIGWRELGLPTDELESHMRETIGDQASETLIRDVEAELAGGPGPTAG